LNVCSEDDESVISDGWIDTIRESLTDNQRQSQHYEDLESTNGQRHSYAPVKPSYADVKASRPITVAVSTTVLTISYWLARCKL